MLLKTRKKGDVLSAKLTSGEEIFGRYVSETSDVIVMSKVMKLVIAANGNPGFTSVLQTSSQEELEFRKDHFILIAATDEQIKNDYIQSTSRITVATPNESAIIQP